MPRADSGAGHQADNGRGVGPAALPWPAPSYVHPTVAPPADTLDVGDMARGIGRRWPLVLGSALLGLAAAGAWVAYGPRRFPGVATVLVRNANDPAGSILSRFGIAGEVAAGASGGGALGSVLKSPLETELKILSSRDIVGQVVDSLGLQAQVDGPRELTARQLVASAAYLPSFRKRTVEFTRRSDGTYAVDGAAARGARLGGDVAIDGVGRVTLAAAPLPERFQLTFEDREDAITRVVDKLDVSKQGGELVELEYTGPDSVTAAAVPNAVIAVYLQRRRTVDRGQNARRLEFLEAKVDSAARELRVAEGALRAEQEASGVLDPELSGKSGVEALAELRQRASEVETERVALGQLVRQATAGSLGARQLAAFPSLLRAPAINTILSQLTTLETERTRLRERRTERDPELAAISTSIRELEGQLLPLAQTYNLSLDREAAVLGGERRELEAQLEALPGQAEAALRGQRDVRRLSQTVLGLQAQILDARLAAIAEGGQVRAVDLAVAAKRQRFPRPPVILLGGLVLGSLVGVTLVLVSGAFARRVQSVSDAERVTGLPTIRLDTDPAADLLVLGPVGMGGTLLVIPADAAAVASARAVVAHATLLAAEHGQVVIGLDGLSLGPGEDARATAGATPRISAPGGLAARLADAEQGAGTRVVLTPMPDDARALALLDPSRVALVVAAADRTGRTALARTADVLARAGVPALGVALVAPAWVARRDMAPWITATAPPPPGNGVHVPVQATV